MYTYRLYCPAMPRYSVGVCTDHYIEMLDIVVPRLSYAFCGIPQSITGSYPSISRRSLKELLISVCNSFHWPSADCADNAARFPSSPNGSLTYAISHCCGHRMRSQWMPDYPAKRTDTDRGKLCGFSGESFD
jgi:hypothetical protein